MKVACQRDGVTNHTSLINFLPWYLAHGGAPYFPPTAWGSNLELTLIETQSTSNVDFNVRLTCGVAMITLFLT